MNNVVALYKTFQGEEFVEASIESIYNNVIKIVFLHSNVGWDGKIKLNSVRPVVEKWKSQNDLKNKIINIDFNSTSQEEQYKFGIKYINKNFENCNYILFIDTDEVWDTTNFERLKKRVLKHKNISAFMCHLYTYVKSPFYRVDPIEPCSPTVIIKSTEEYLGVRGHRIIPRMLLDDVFFHHFSYVRKDESTVFEKIITTTLADGVYTVDIDKWKKEKWENILNAKDFHTSRGYEDCWKSIKIITKNELPEVFHHRKFDIIENNNPEELDNLTYWSEHGQDRWLNKNIFKNKKNGVYVEVGALDGINGSNSKFFENYFGWNGLCVEANMDSFINLRVNRPKAICENYAIGDKNRIVEFLAFEGKLRGWSGVAEYIEPQHWERINKKIGVEKWRSSKIEMITLPALLEKHNIFNIDYLSLDIEGAELFVLKSFDFKKFNVYVFDIENNFDNPLIEKIMNENGYKKIIRLQINDIYMKESQC